MTARPAAGSLRWLRAGSFWLAVLVLRAGFATPHAGGLRAAGQIAWPAGVVIKLANLPFEAQPGVSCTSTSTAAPKGRARTGRYRSRPRLVSARQGRHEYLRNVKHDSHSPRRVGHGSPRRVA
jgi:hypothetical protein